MARLMLQLIAAAVGTMAFALLYGTPRRYLAQCGIAGGTGWLLYLVFTAKSWCTEAVAVFLAAFAVVFLSRVFAVKHCCPAAVFITTGIFPLVPGVKVYWTAYYIVTDQLQLALESGFEAVKLAAAIVLGIALMFEVPNRFFHRQSPGDHPEDRGGGNAAGICG